MRTVALMGCVAALAGAGATPAAAQETGSLTLLCRGYDEVAMPVYSWSGTLSRMNQTREAAQISVVVEGDKVRVRPSRGSRPIFSKDSDDGWYELTDVKVDRLSIRGRLNWNRLERPKLDIDRRTGAVTFDLFTGVCQPVSTVPEATRF